MNAQVDLDALLNDVIKPPPATSTPPHWPSGAARGVAKISYTHDAMIDLIIANPAVSQNSLALHFGYSPSWVSQVMACDAFQDRLAERTKELVDPTIRASVDQRFKAMILRSLDILREKLDRPSNDIPDQLALRTLELSSRALGYGARVESPKTEVNVEVHLEQMGENLVKLLHKKKAEVPAIDAEIYQEHPSE